MLSRYEIESRLERLSVRHGGSLAGNIQKAEIAGNTNVLFIGLGGMGCKTVNKMREICEKEFDSWRDNVGFLVIDSDRYELHNIAIGAGNGYISSNNMIYIGVDNPAAINGWVDSDVQVMGRLDIGAQGIRQVGRAMLCGTVKYNELKRKIEDAIHYFGSRRSPMHVVLISGLSGGTGSGIFIDVAVMVRKIFEELVTEGDLFCTFYTPDVQKYNSDGVEVISPSQWAYHCENAYAAIKELDYFTKDIAEYRLQNDFGTVEFRGKVFEQNKIFIVSGTEACKTRDEIITSAAYSMLNRYQTHPVAVEPTFFNLFSNVVGTTSGYSALGYNAIGFSTDEMVTYCSDQLYRKVMDKWENDNDFTNETVTRILDGCGLSSVYDIFKRIIQREDFERELCIDESDERCPRVKTTLGRVHNVDIVLNYAREKAYSAFNLFCRRGANRNYSNIAVEILRDMLSNVGFLYEYGPLFPVHVLKGKKDVLGCIDRLISFAGAELQEVNRVAHEKFKNVERALEDAGINLKSRIITNSSQVREFIHLCDEYVRAYFEFRVFNDVFHYVLKDAVSILEELYYSKFELRKNLFYSIGDMLERDCDAIAHGVGITQSKSVFSLNGASNNAHRIRGFLDNVADDVADVFSHDIISRLFNTPDCCILWEELENGAGNGLIEEIRRAFCDAVCHPVLNNVEQLAALAYVDDTYYNGMLTGGSVSQADLTNMWNNLPVRNFAISLLCQDILSEVGRGLDFEYENVVDMADLMNVTLVTMPSSTPCINAQLTNMMGNNAMTFQAQAGYIPAITFMKTALNVSLPLVKNMAEYAAVYAHSNTPGRHLDRSWI